MLPRRAPFQSRPLPSQGGSLGAFLLPGPTRSRKKKKKQTRVAAPPVVMAEAEARAALPSHSRLPLPEHWRGMSENSSTFRTAWQQAASFAFNEHRLLIRAHRLVQLLAELRTTRYRMAQHGLKEFCQLGSRTTLYRLGEVL